MSRSLSKPVPKKKQPRATDRENEITDLLWNNEDAQTLMGQAADQLEAAAQQITARFDLDLAEALLWITETVCARYGLPALVYPFPETSHDRICLTDNEPDFVD